MRKIIKELYLLKDEKYKEFNQKIVNTNKNMIGVRTPLIKDKAKKINDINSFFKEIKDEYYEEILLEGFVIANIKDYNLFINKIDDFIYKIDNWAVCDMTSSACKIVNKNKESMLLYIDENIKSKNVWMVRFCFTLLLNYYIDDKYIDLVFDYINNDNNDFYYIMMVKAWLISKCYIYYKDKTLLFLKNSKIDSITYNKAIDKICDSLRVDKNDKLLLRKMKKR